MSDGGGKSDVDKLRESIEEVGMEDLIDVKQS